MYTFFSQYYLYYKIWNIETQTSPTICNLSRLLKVLILKDHNTFFKMTPPNMGEDHFHFNAMSDFKMGFTGYNLRAYAFKSYIIYDDY